MLGVRPTLGRLLESSDYQPGKQHVVMLTHAGWQRLFSGDNGVLGRELMLNGIPFTVVGVLPADFRLATRSEIWVPRIFTANELSQRGAHFLNVMARLNPGVSVEQARQEMGAIASRLSEQYPDSNRDWGTVVTPFPELVVRDVRPALLLLMGAVGLVLLIACANVANMLLARASARAREIAVRAAIGASRGRLIRQLLTESLLLSGMGGGLGMLLAFWSTAVLSANLAGVLPRAAELSVDRWVVGFTAGASVLAGLMFGMAPAWMVSRANLHETLKEGGGSGSAERRGWLRNTLVVGEIAIAVVLVAGSALLIQSFARLQNVQPGFRVDHGLTFYVSLPRAKYPERPQQAAFFEKALERIRALPGVEAATLASGVPLSGDDELYSFQVEGRPITSEAMPSPLYYLVSPDYFRTMGIPLIAGRVFTPQDVDGAPRVTVINRALAERIFPGENPVGERIRLGRNESIVREIVGVVANTKHYGLGENEVYQVYDPFAQMPRSGSSFVLRTSVDPGSLAEAVRREVQTVDAEQPVVGIQTLESLSRDSVAQPRFRTVLLSLFSGLALLLASVGVYGVMSYVVARRRQEIGIRVALSAGRKDVIGLVVGKGLRLAGIGIAIGLAGAFAATRLLQSMLFGIQATDVQTYVLTSVVLLIVALLACSLPALRASRVDPIAALRYE